MMYETKAVCRHWCAFLSHHIENGFLFSFLHVVKQMSKNGSLMLCSCIVNVMCISITFNINWMKKKLTMKCKLQRKPSNICITAFNGGKQDPQFLHQVVQMMPISNMRIMNNGDWLNWITASCQKMINTSSKLFPKHCNHHLQHQSSVVGSLVYTAQQSCQWGRRWTIIMWPRFWRKTVSCGWKFWKRLVSDRLFHILSR